MRETKVAEAARVLQMEHLMDRKPSQLSGGQRQRAAIAEDKIYAPGTEIGLRFDPARAHLSHRNNRA